MGINTGMKKSPASSEAPHAGMAASSADTVAAGAGRGAAAGARDDDCRKVFVGNLPGRVRENTLVDLFEKAGPIESLRIPRNYFGYTKRFAFVVYKDADAQRKAVDLLNNHVLDDHTLTVELVVPPEQLAVKKQHQLLQHADADNAAPPRRRPLRTNAPRAGRPHTAHAHATTTTSANDPAASDANANAVADATSDADTNAPARRPRRPRRIQPRRNKPRLAQAEGESAAAQSAESEVDHAAAVAASTDGAGADAAETNNAAAAAAVSRPPRGSKTLRPKRRNPPPRTTPQAAINAENENNESAESSHGDDAGARRAPPRPRTGSSAARRHGAQGAPRARRSGVPSDTSLFVANLAYSVTNASLGALFSDKGYEVLEAYVVTGYGRSKGFGFIEFASHADQERALNEMNGATIDGRPIAVRVALTSTKRGAQGAADANAEAHAGANADADADAEADAGAGAAPDAGAHAEGNGQVESGDAQEQQPASC